MKNCSDELSRIIHGKYRSEEEFASDMGWNRQKMNRIKTGKQLPDIAELNLMSELLDVGAADLLMVFLPEKEQKQKETLLQEIDRKRSEQIQFQMKCSLARCEGRFLAVLEHMFDLHGMGGDERLYSGGRWSYKQKIPHSGRIRQGHLAIIFEYVEDEERTKNP